MRLAKVMLSVALGVLLVAAAANAARQPRPPVEDGTLTVRDGRGLVQVHLKGTVIGQLGRGRLVLTRSPDAVVVVRGAENDYDLGPRTTVYTGTKIRFRVADDKRLAVKVVGKGQYFSAVGRGDVVFDGSGDPEEGIFYDGTYSLNGADFQSLPNERTRLELAAPPGS